MSPSTKLFAIIAALTIAAASPAAADDRQIVESFYANVLSSVTAPDIADRAAKVLAPNWESIGDYSGKNKTRAQFIAQLAGFGKLIPNLKWMPQEIIREGNRYVVRSRFTGTPKGPLFGVDGGGKSFDAMSIDIHTVENGMIVKTHHVEDWASVLRQLGNK